MTSEPPGGPRTEPRVPRRRASDAVRQGPTRLGPGGEFDLVRDLMRRWGDLASGIGDDCAVLDVPSGERLCVSTDSAVDGVHFRRDWLSPEEIGYRATAAALSDLAAMAARPLGVLAAITVPDAWRPVLGEMADGIGEAVRAAGTAVIGGDLTRGAELSLTITVLGASAVPVTRSGARAGDRVYVTGRLGGPLGALEALRAGTTPTAAHRARFVHPVPRLAEARWLAGHGARAMIDVSDGLLADAGHVAAASGVALVIDLERLPLAPGVSPQDAAHGGEEYELVAVAPHAFDVAAFEHLFGIPLTEIGCVEAPTDGTRGGVVARWHGERVDLPHGHDHFSG